MGRIQFRGARFQTLSSVSVLGSLSSGERTQRVAFSESELTEFLAELTGFAAELSEFSSETENSTLETVCRQFPIVSFLKR